MDSLILADVDLEFPPLARGCKLPSFLFSHLGQKNASMCQDVGLESTEVRRKLLNASVWGGSGRRAPRPGKLDRARSRLYRSEILQENMRLEALAEIYTVHSFAQLCNLNFLSKFCKKVC